MENFQLFIKAHVFRPLESIFGLILIIILSHSFLGPLLLCFPSILTVENGPDPHLKPFVSLRIVFHYLCAHLPEP